MSTVLTSPAETPVAEKFDLAAYKAQQRAAEQARRDGKAPEAPKIEVKVTPPAVDPAVDVKAEPVVVEAKVETPVIEEPKPKRPSGDERKFRNALSKRDREIGELRAKLDMLMPQAQPVQAVAVDSTPIRENFTTDEEFRRAEIKFEAKKVVDEQRAVDLQAQEIRDTAKSYRERMANGPEKYEDFESSMESAKGTALGVDLAAECPSLLGAILNSPYPEDCFYHWFKHPEQLQSLITTYKTGPAGVNEAIAKFHRLEGKVGIDGIPAKKAEEKPKEPKVEVKEEVKPVAEAVKAVPVAEKPPLPRPSSEVGVRGGQIVDSDAPPPMIPGTTLRNPARKAWDQALMRR